MEARILLLSLCSANDDGRGLRLCAKKACVVQRLSGCVFFVGKYRSGLREDACASWTILQVRMKKMTGNGNFPFSSFNRRSQDRV